MKKEALSIILSCLAFSFLANAASIAQIINSPGYYQFGNIEATPTDANDYVISVETNDVIIDFQGAVISQQAGNTVSGLSGVRLAPNVSNVCIKNIAIRGLTGKGVLVEEGCSDVMVENLTINGCDAGGIVFIGTTADHIQRGMIDNCLISSCTGENGGTAYGCRLIECDNVTVQNSTFLNNDGSTLASGFGLSLEWCSACKVLNCQANDNGGNTLAVGINIYQSKWTLVSDCKVLNTIGRASGSEDRAVGVLLDQSTDNAVLNSITYHNHNLVSKGYGFESRDGSGNVFKKCFAENNVGGTSAAGFALRSNENRTSVFKCESRRNDGGASGVGYGILLESGQNCDVLFNRVLDNTGATGVGLKDTVVDTTNLIAGNVSFANTTTAFDVQTTGNPLPVLSASTNDFSAVQNVSNYMNIDFN
jgi:Right handed beta helix region